MTDEQGAADYMSAEWYVYRNGTGETALWQARTVKHDDLIASAYTREHIERIVHDHEAAEHYEDLHDWAKRWQAGRRENTRLKESTPASRQGNLMARIILGAKEMNDELDGILALLDTVGEETSRE